MPTIAASWFALLSVVFGLSRPLFAAAEPVTDAAPSASSSSVPSPLLPAPEAPSSSTSMEPPPAPGASAPRPNAVERSGADSADAAASAAPVTSVLPASTATSLPSGSVAESGEEGIVHLHERNVFAIKVRNGNRTAEARARAASQALEHLVEEKDFPDLHVEEQGDLAIVFGGKTPIIQLGLEDAAASGDASLAIHSASVTAKIKDALATERQRKSIAESVFSFSLLVFSALIAVLLLGKVRELAQRSRGWIEANPDRLPALRVQSIDLMRPAAVRGGLSVALSLGRLLSQLGIAYGWLLFASSLFEATRTYTERLTGFVLAPLSALIGRVGSALPLLVIALSAVIATVLLVRFVGLFFGSVARGETTLGWLPSDLAVPTGALVRFGIVVVALLVAAPLITGNDDGALARAGVAALVAIGFASSPVLASVAAGVPAVYGRKVRVGDYAEVGGKVGRVLSMTLLEVRLEDEIGCQIRVPHLMSLFYSTRVIGSLPVATLEVTVDPLVPQGRVRSVLMSTARGFGSTFRVDLIKLDSSGAHYRVTARGTHASSERDLATAIADSLASESIALGRTTGDRS